MIILLIFLPALCLTQPTLSSTFDWTIELTVYGKKNLGKTCACARGVKGLSPVSDSYSGGLGPRTWSGSERVPLPLHYNTIPTIIPYQLNN